MTAREAPAKPDDLKEFLEQKDRTGTADYCAASPDDSRALGIPLIRGRLFDDRDQFDQPHVALISESLAKSRWPGEDLPAEWSSSATWTAISGCSQSSGLSATRGVRARAASATDDYVNLLQRPRFFTSVVMRSNADRQSIASAARAVLHDSAPEAPPRFRTFEQIYAASLGRRRFNLTLVGVFAGTALILAVAGIYGVMAYDVTRRRREIGVRMALGASTRDVVRIVLGQGLVTIAIGIAVGVVGALGLTRGVQSLLFDVTPTDPIAFATVVFGLAGVAAVACYLPARSRTRVDPAEALRE